MMDEKRTATAIEVAPTDAFQIELKKLIDGETEWSRSGAGGATDLEAQRRQQVHALFDGAERVDLVGHSTPIKRFLKLGDWVLDPDEAARLASYMPASVTSVRMIGCATASTAEGRAAVEAITRSGLSAYGTINKVYTTHFDKQGVKRGSRGPGLREFLPAAGPPARPSPAAVAAPAAPPVARTYAPDLTARRARLTVPRPIAWLARPILWLARCMWALIAIPLAVLRWLFRRPFIARRIPHQQILWLLSPRSTPMPGLLTEPLLIFEVTSKGKTWTLEILFDFEYARFYSSASSAAKRERVYKIRGFARVAKTVLEKYLELAPRGVQLIGRHDEAGSRGGPLAADPKR